jgi:hypothetical protein
VPKDGNQVFYPPSVTPKDRVTSRHAFLFMLLSLLTLTFGAALFWLLPQTEIMPSLVSLIVGAIGSILLLGVALFLAVRGFARARGRTHAEGYRALRPLGMTLALILMVVIVGVCLVNSLLVVLIATNTYP